MHTRISRLSIITALSCSLLSGASCGITASEVPIHAEPTPHTTASQDTSQEFEDLRKNGIHDHANIDLNALEPGEVCVINVSENETKKLDVFALSRGYIKKKRRILNSLGFVMSILHVPPGHTVQQGIVELRHAFPSHIIDANHHYYLQGQPRQMDPRLYGHRLVKWNAQAVNCAAQDIPIGMIDTPVDRNRLPLHHRTIHTESFLPAKAPKATDYHGTAVATLLVGQAHSMSHALLPKASLFVAEAFRRTKTGNTEATTWSIVRGLDWLVEQDVQIINLSLGGPPNALLSYATKKTLEQGIPIIAAGGNAGPQGPSIYPAAQPGVIAVTALDANLNPYRYASRGPYIAFSAPGVDIWIPHNDEDGVFQSGTSFAAPFVTTAAATVKQLHPNWTPEQVAHHLANTALDLGQNGKDNTFGWGLIQIPQTCRTHRSSIQTSS
ncbi:MAG: protease [Nitrospirales bacterium]|nr:MAG: protease [Nitrospirales bacterium]